MPKQKIKMVKIIQLISLFLIGICISCDSDSPSPSPNITDSSTAQDSQNLNANTRAPNVRKLSTSEIFDRVPKDLFELELFSNLESKDKKALLESGKWGNLTAKPNGNWLKLAEQRESEDDKTEKLMALDMATFQHEYGEKIIYMNEKVYKEGDVLAQNIKTIFYRYNGREWFDITDEVPVIKTKDFFNETIDLSSITKDYIDLEYNEENPQSLKATLRYIDYMKDENIQLEPEKFIEAQAYHVALEWTGKAFSVVRAPAKDIQ
ncbi:MAG: hypothetical protein MK212_16605 [Saprospiraceae bacterium]|nr:hypothetical protein [Saprospiraceae bacterium]